MDYSEKSFVEDSAIEVLRELGWEIKENHEIYRVSEKSPILMQELKDSLKKINLWISEDQVEEVICKLLEEKTAPPEIDLRKNKEKHFLIKDGIDVSIKGQINQKRRAKLIDFNNVEKNSFTAVPQLKMRGQHIDYLCIPDLVCFVNGLPLLFAEFKASHIPAMEGYNNNYRNYKNRVPQLFTYNAFCVFSNGIHSKIGTIGSEFDFFADWPRLKEDDKRNTNIEILIRGVCKKENFLDLFENFIVFSEQEEKKGEKKITKILARNHQFLGVNLAFESYLKRRERKGKLGTFWHTQGSGKSYSILFLTEKIQRKFSDDKLTFIILTDRRELERQILSTFKECGLLETEECFRE